ncbi:MAG: high-potential iron-sulfur protein [Bdellovibrio sp.]
MSKMNRRDFFSAVVKIAGVAAVAPTVLASVFTSKAYAQKKRGEAPAAGGAMPMVDPKDPQAKSLQYTEDAKKSPNSKGNKCATCGFYTKKETRNGKEVGTCTIFTGKLVYSDAWCASWNKKA